MSERQLEDEQLLRILGENSREGMVLLSGRYLGLVWYEVSKYLENVEDVKECVNDTFAEFYFRREYFDVKKSSIAHYLVTIARNQSVSRWRKEKLRVTEAILTEQGNEDSEICRAEMRVDVEQALHTLKEEDAELIRMKYYDGKTIKEAAESLGLPYETVKKRHRRALGKLSRVLLIILLWMMLAITAFGVYKGLVYLEIIPEWSVLEKNFGGDEKKNSENHVGDVEIKERSFPEAKKEEKKEEESEDVVDEGDAPFIPETYVPGFGLNEKPGKAIYVLTGPVSANSDKIAISLDEAYYQDGILQIRGIKCLKNVEYGTQEYWDLMDLDAAAVAVDGVEWELIYAGRAERMTDDYVEVAEWYFRNPIHDEEKEKLNLVFSYYGLEITLVITEEKEILLEENGAVVMQMEKYGGLTAIARREDGRLIVAIQPVDRGETYRTLPGLIRGAFGDVYAEGLTVTAEDGTCLMGECVHYKPMGKERYFEWDFGVAEPGEYTLYVPFVIQQPNRKEELRMPIDIEKLCWEDREYGIPGAFLRVENCIWQGKEDAYGIWKDIYDTYLLRVKCRAADEEHTVLKYAFWGDEMERWPEDIIVDVNAALAEKEAEGAFAPPTDGGRPLVNVYPEGEMETLNAGDENGVAEMKLKVNKLYYDASTFALVYPLDGYMNGESPSVDMRWNQEFHLTFTVE